MIKYPKAACTSLPDEHLVVLNMLKTMKLN